MAEPEEDPEFQQEQPDEEEQQEQEQLEEEQQEQEQEYLEEEQQQEQPDEEQQEQEQLEEEQQEMPDEEEEQQQQEQEQQEEHTQEQQDEQQQETEQVEEEMSKKIDEENKVDAEDANLFAGGYETFEEKDIFAPRTAKEELDDKYHSDIKEKRPYHFKIVITRAKREFEGPITFFLEKSSNEEATVGNNEVKGALAVTEYPMKDRPYIEMGFQTANRSETKSFEVAKKEYKNSYTQVVKNLGDIQDQFAAIRRKYLNETENVRLINEFLNDVKSKMEEALQSNETINLFKNDFDLDKVSHVQSEDKKKGEQEVRTFKDNSSGNKNKKEKCVFIIRSIKETDAFIAHSLLRNFVFDDRIKVEGIPYQSQILFWNIKDIEQNSPIFSVETPCEVTAFEFSKDDCDYFACALSSGQIMFVRFKDIISILKMYSDPELSTQQKRMNKKEFYTSRVSLLNESHKGRINAVKWFPPGYSLSKKNQIVYSEDDKNVCIAATLGDDGQVIIWDVKNLEWNVDKTGENENAIVGWMKKIKIEINKVDIGGKLSGMGLALDIVGDKILFYISTDEGQIYCVDSALRPAPDNPAANVINHYYNRYFRPVLYFQISPFFDNIFWTVHDFHFCLWTKTRSKPIFISPNLKKSSYTCGQFSPSRPGVLYLCRSNGKIDIWDFLDESHKPSVKDSFIKETITSIEFFKYVPPVDENAENQTKTYIEYMNIGDISGQMTVLEVPKWFCDPAADEVKIMKEFFNNEISRQEYMDRRYKAMEENALHGNKDGGAAKKEENETQKHNRLKYEEDDFQNIRKDIMRELGISVPKTDQEKEKEKVEKDKEENEK